MTRARQWDKLIRQVIKLTRKEKPSGFVALYAWGSAVTGETDPWSDLDLCLIQDTRIATDPSAVRDWMLDVQDAFEYKADPTAIPLDALGCDAHWEYASYQWGLRRSGRLLLGRDIRRRICAPGANKLRLCVLHLAHLCVRRLYGVNRAKRLPQKLPPPDPRRAWPTPHHGNFAWQIVTALLQMLRAIVFIEAGVVCESKREIPAQLRARGEKTLAPLCDRALAIRRSVSRHEMMLRLPPAVRSLAAAVPMVFQRLSDAMRAQGLKDPSYEPKGGGYYRADGTPAPRARRARKITQRK